VHGYYDPLLAMADRAVDEGFLRRDHRELLLAETDPARLLDRLSSYTVPIVDKWMDRGAR
jgi:predicted Rossmann-fold nucleotide-binding protein